MSRIHNHQIFAKATAQTAILLVLGNTAIWIHEARAENCSWRFSSLFERKIELSAAQRIEGYRLAGKRQEAAYLLRKSGDIKAAEVIEKDIEKILKHSRVQKTEKLSTAKGATASDPVLVTFEDGTRAIRKSGKDQVANVDSEVLAYEIDKTFGRVFGVPVTIAREIDGVRYSFQYFIEEAKTTTSHSNNLNFFDYLLDNPDRNPRNTLSLKAEGTEAPIDHGMGLRTAESRDKGWDYGVDWSRLLGSTCSSWRLKKWQWYSKKVDLDCMAKLVMQRAPDRAVYDQFKAISDEQWRALLARFSKSSEIDAFLKRRHFFIETLDRELGTGQFHFNK